MTKLQLMDDICQAADALLKIEEMRCVYHEQYLEEIGPARAKLTAATKALADFRAGMPSGFEKDIKTLYPDLSLKEKPCGEVMIGEPFEGVEMTLDLDGYKEWSDTRVLDKRKDGYF